MIDEECYFIRNKKCEKNGKCIHRLNHYCENEELEK